MSRGGIAQGQKLTELRATKLGPIVNGWQYSNPRTGMYGNDYLLSAATVLAINIATNVPQEATYPVTTVDGDGKQLNGSNNYVIHFDSGKTPPINKNGYWSITIYNKKDYLVENPLNRYSINSIRNESKFNKDNPLIYTIQHTNPGIDKESNWLPSPLVIHTYDADIYSAGKCDKWRISNPTCSTSKELEGESNVMFYELI